MTAVQLQVLDQQKRRVLAAQAEVTRAGEFYLAGGNGLALRLGHRKSRDFDWFTPHRFSPGELVVKLKTLSLKPSSFSTKSGAHTVRASYGDLETSFIYYGQSKASPELVSVAKAEIFLADVAQLAAMKAAAVHDRGLRRDFIDIHTICQQPGWSVGRFIEHAARRLPLSPEQVARALTYFADAVDDMPEGFKTPWKKVQKDLTDGVRAWEKERDQDLGR